MNAWFFSLGTQRLEFCKTSGSDSTLCLMICWVILAAWVPIGSAELSRLSVALNHSPNGSKASWNWRARTCSSSNCLCLRGRGDKDGWAAEGGGGAPSLLFYCLNRLCFCLHHCEICGWFCIIELFCIKRTFNPRKLSSKVFCRGLKKQVFLFQCQEKLTVHSVCGFCRGQSNKFQRRDWHSYIMFSSMLSHSFSWADTSETRLDCTLCVLNVRDHFSCGEQRSLWNYL